ncbi:YegS/Rv2252/BmrU family lipid kinase [Coprococcus catus]|jgi:diacylglycerol kinase (ATP)|uniref:YegS/Rv2252/BmrU family lipid kinase n=3 Tax=Coprococcus TaxID=33042 RepID=A0A3E2XN90_9FIRM|nr:YegS/Rv2252/BmrU family lipid kinase [Coprococcus catus]MDD6342917.1 YegS/Rv2252/BmrU family lipid kinase [Coprococcus catus]RGB81935.1 YegS/Rv2252/BmrU family lipid kinase [Coprococcus catus]RGC48928.1 YegS/Rv2252/BmrU family lipid kinase [Coprococcus catus]
MNFIEKHIGGLCAMEQRVLLMVNPMAGRQKIRNELLYVVDTLTKAGYETIIYTTQGKDATRDLLAEKDSQFDRVICCGGDGTFNEILSATMHWDKRPILGYIPAGTTNDFAAGLKLPSDIREAAVNIVRGTPHTVDAGLFNTSYFSYVASFGAFTETSYSTPQNFKNALGHLAYILEGIKEIPAFTSYTVCVEADGQIYKDSYIFGAVSNARSVGGILKISDSLVDLNDGVFEVMMIKMPKTLMDLSAIVTSLTSLNPLKYDPSMFLFLQTKELKITFEQEMVWSLDGERVSGGKEARIACIKDAFKILTV